MAIRDAGRRDGPRGDRPERRRHLPLRGPRDGEDVEHTGEYLEIDRPRQLVFTFSAEGSEADRMIVYIAPLESGCAITLIHEMNPAWAEYADRAREG